MPMIRSRTSPEKKPSARSMEHIKCIGSVIDEVDRVGNSE
jgi:hypothetical protein